MSDKLFVTFDLPVEVRSRLEASFSVTYAGAGFRLIPGADIGQIEGHDYLLVSATQDKLDARLIEALPRTLRAVGTYSVGHDHVDLDSARSRQLAVFFTPDVLSSAVAEVGMLLLLGAARRVTESIDLLRSRQWKGWSPTQLNGTGMSGKNLGILGMGRIGREIADRARAFGMTIHYANRSRLDAALEKDARFHADVESMLHESQFLMLASPATPQTLGFLDRRRIALLPHAAIVANVGRGALVVDEDLVQALKSGRVAAAGLDVFNGEPNIHEAYYALPNVFMLPHIGSSTVEARRAMADVLASGFKSLASGEGASNRIA